VGDTGVYPVLALVKAGRVVARARALAGMTCITPLARPCRVLGPIARQLNPLSSFANATAVLTQSAPRLARADAATMLATGDNEKAATFFTLSFLKNAAASSLARQKLFAQKTNSADKTNLLFIVDILLGTERQLSFDTFWPKNLAGCGPASCFWYRPA